ncbi:MAG: signal peptide peptidase SppA [Candidatus Nanoarchaeia archaeon]
MKEKKEHNNKTTLAILAFVGVGLIVVFVVVMLFLAALFNSDSAGSLSTGNVAIIEVNGIIQTQTPNSVLGGDVASSNEIRNYIEKAANDRTVKAILIKVNSQGGSPVATDEIASAIKSTNKTTVAVIRDVGASGGYWIASACDQIFANKMSLVGSIGVTSAHLGFDEFIKEHNVSYRRLVSGEYKDIGSPFKEMTQEEKKIFQKKLDVLHEIFIQEVKENRDMDEEQIKKVSTGLFWTGLEAKELELIDEFGGEKDAITFIEKEQGISANKIKYTKQPSFTDILMGAVQNHAFSMGEGIGSSIAQESKPEPHSISV